MALDIPTLMLVGAFVALLSGAMLIFAWYQYQDMSPALVWAISNIVMGFGVAAMAFGAVLDQNLLLMLARVGLTVSPALIWLAARQFDQRSPSYLLVAAGPVAVLGLLLLTPRLLPSGLGETVGTLLAALYLVAAAASIAFHSARLASRWPLTGFLLLHALTLASAPFATAGLHGIDVDLVPLNSLFGLIHFEALIFLVGTTIFVVAGMREASEERLRQAASLDSLTGLLNRGALFNQGGIAADACRLAGMPLAVAVFDLDHFKSINDRFGHGTGDRILELFAQLSATVARPTDIVGRLGGEEFAIFFPRTSAEAAAVIVERFRASFQHAAMFMDGRRVDATFSAGIASATGPAIVLPMLVSQADAALYGAKSLGRNRIELQRPEMIPPPDGARVIRIA